VAGLVPLRGVRSKLILGKVSDCVDHALLVAGEGEHREFLVLLRLWHVAAASMQVVDIRIPGRPSIYEDFLLNITPGRQATAT
jgi:hypothetical protein